MSAAMLWAAFIIDIIVGDPQWLPHPVRGIGWIISRLEKLFGERSRKPYVLKIYGIALAFLVVAGVFFASRIVLLIAGWCSPTLQWITALLLAYTCLAVKSLYRESWIVIKAVRSRDIRKARLLLSRIVGRDTVHLDERQILTAVVETIAENLSDGIIAPLFYLTVGGVPAAMAFKAVSTIDSMIGYRNDRYQDIGWFGARLDDAANFIPARITALLLIVSSLLMGLNYRGAWKIWRRDARKHASPNAGHPEAAMAGALGIQIGGPGSYFGEVKQKAYIGDPTGTIGLEHACKAEKLLFACSLAMTAIMSIIL